MIMTDTISDGGSAALKTACTLSTMFTLFTLGIIKATIILSMQMSGHQTVVLQSSPVNEACKNSSSDKYKYQIENTAHQANTNTNFRLNTAPQTNTNSNLKFKTGPQAITNKNIN